VHPRHAEVLFVRVRERPRAINVVTTGMPVRSAKASNSWAARDFSVPPPT